MKARHAILVALAAVVLVLVVAVTAAVITDDPQRHDLSRSPVPPRTAWSRIPTRATSTSAIQQPEKRPRSPRTHGTRSIRSSRPTGSGSRSYEAIRKRGTRRSWWFERTVQTSASFFRRDVNTGGSTFSRGRQTAARSSRSSTLRHLRTPTATESSRSSTPSARVANSSSHRRSHYRSAATTSVPMTK